MNHTAYELLNEYIKNKYPSDVLVRVEDDTYRSEQTDTLYHVMTEQEAEERFLFKTSSKYSTVKELYEVKHGKDFGLTLEEYTEEQRQMFGRSDCNHYFHDEIDLGGGYVAHIIEDYQIGDAWWLDSFQDMLNALKDELNKLKQEKNTQQVLTMMQNNESPAELIDLIAKELGVSDGTPKPTNDKTRYEIDGRLYYVLNNQTADKYAKDLAEEVVDDYLSTCALGKYVDRQRVVRDFLAKNGRAKYLAFDDEKETKIEYQGASLYFYRLE